MCTRFVNLSIYIQLPTLKGGKVRFKVYQDISINTAAIQSFSATKADKDYYTLTMISGACYTVDKKFVEKVEGLIKKSNCS